MTISQRVFFPSDAGQFHVTLRPDDDDDDEVGKSRARGTAALSFTFRNEDAGRKNRELINWLSEGNPPPSE